MQSVKDWLIDLGLAFPLSAAIPRARLLRGLH
jgi:hypothetical protein